MITRHRLTNWALALLVVALYPLMATLEDRSQRRIAAAHTQDLQTAIKNEAAQVRFERAASEICGQNAGWQLVDDTRTIQCTTKRGFKTRKAVL